MRALIVPFIAISLWLVPSDRPNTEVAGAIEVASLADATPFAATSPSVDAQPEATEPLSTVSPTTTLAAVTSTTAAGEPTVLDTTTVAGTPTTIATPDSGSGNVLASDPSVAVTPTTTTSTTIAPTTTVSSLTLGEQALQRVSFDWRAAFPTWDVQFLGPRNGIRALTYPGERRIEIFVRSSDTAATLHRVFAHELGHVIDVERNSDEDRARWLEQRGLAESTRWWPNAEAPDFATGAGDFAEAFAVWETGVTTRSTLAGQPTRADLDLLRELSQG